MNATLHNAEAIGDERRIGQSCVGSRVGARAVKVGERGRLIDEHAAGQVDRERNAAVDRGFVRRFDGRFVRAVHGECQRAVLSGERGGEWLLAAEAEQRLEAALDRFDEALLRYRWPLEGTRRAAA